VTYFNWKPEIALGHEQIDEQHKQLFALAGAAARPLFFAPEDGQAADPLQALIDFAREHFAYEEALMGAADFPGAEQHAESHALLLAELVAHCAKVRGGSSAYPAGLIGFLWNWLNLHIGSEDRKLVAWLATRTAP